VSAILPSYRTGQCSHSRSFSVLDSTHFTIAHDSMLVRRIRISGTPPNESQGSLTCRRARLVSWLAERWRRETAAHCARARRRSGHGLLAADRVLCQNLPAQRPRLLGLAERGVRSLQDLRTDASRARGDARATVGARAGARTGARAAARRPQVGSGMRGDKRRTVRTQDDQSSTPLPAGRGASRTTSAAPGGVRQNAEGLLTEAPIDAARWCD
jgi:hypothetical protein